MTCECCGGQGGHGGFGCNCADALFCMTCNYCHVHCRCQVSEFARRADVEPTWSKELAAVKSYWRQQGVAL